ncbi:glycosyltransferase family 2 protein [Anatilimnocola sp. NA78]|uniref:glycosyltransferase family 2 protein n=1 Tax=Anatilimnocola sp. NA78 TaxID=3415683 RepID=UPI003CE5C563
MNPTVSIILPTFNRAKFLPAAFAAIKGQTFTDWELIIVDDGSADSTREVVAELCKSFQQPVHYLHQENQGPAGARNRGLESASGKYVAFFDSDDEWLPHHLSQGVHAMDSCEEVDWVFSACRRIELPTRKVLIDNTFYDETSRFRSLKTRRVGELCIIDDPNLRCCGLRGSGFGGMQCTIARRQVFSKVRFESCSFFEDRIVLMHAIESNVRFGYFETVNVLVYTHDTNVSFANPDIVRNRITAFRTYISTLERLRTELPRNQKELRAFDGRLGHEYFWSLGYPLFQLGNHREALAHMRRAIYLCPSNLRFIKTYCASICKVMLGCAPYTVGSN